MIWLLTLAPLFIVLELCQLVLCERYLGIKQLATGRDPRTLPMSERLAFWWTIGLLAYWCWIGALLAGPAGRLQAGALFAISLAGLSLRRHGPRRWVLVVLTFEGALRIGMLLSLLGVAWRHLR